MYAPVAVSALVWCGAAEAEERVSLRQIEEQLDATPPCCAAQPERLRIFQQLDAWALAPDTVYHDMKPETSNADFHAFYLRRMRKALDEIGKTKVLGGVVIWKMYSSGVVVKSTDGVFAIDVVEGPLKSIHKSPADYPAFVFQWTPDMRERYARLVDVHLITHWHYDHASYALARALVEAGKAVVVPQQLRRAWADKLGADALRVVEPEVDHKIGPIVVQTFDGVQSMTLDDKKEWARGPHDAQNNIYWVRAGGVQLMHKGDHRGKPWYDWLARLKEQGKGIDVFFSMVNWPRDMHEHLDREFDPIVIPVHEHEVGHKPLFGVSPLASRYRGLGQRRLKRGKGAVLAWGERLVVPAVKAVPDT